MKENNEVMSAKSKENKIEDMKQAIKKVAEKREYVEEYKVGDEYILNTEVYKVVEVLGNGDYHLKNTAPPYNSFLTTDGERF